jgi:hypothetical protein
MQLENLGRHLRLYQQVMKSNSTLEFSVYEIRFDKIQEDETHMVVY